jgi:ACS family glucarate transporter-like MFS transporter
MSIAAPDIMREFSLSETQFGTILSAFLLTYSLMMIPGGNLADRFGPRVVLAFMAFGAALFTGLTALGGSPVLAWMGVLASFVAMRFGLGLATAPLYPSCARMNANWTPFSERARVWGWIACGAGIGGATSPLLFAWMIASFGWRAAFWLAALATAFIGLLWTTLVRNRPARPEALREHPQDRPTSTPWAKLLKNRQLLRLTLSYFAVNYFEYIFFYWLYYYFGEIRHMGKSQSALYTSAIWVAWTVMTPIGGWVTDQMVERFGRKTGRRIVPLACLTSSAILLSVGVNLTDPLAVVAVLWLSLGLASATDGAYWSSAIDLGREHVGAASSIMNAGGNLGGFFAPVLTPLIAGYLGWSWGLYAGSLIMLGGVLLWFFIDTTQKLEDAAEHA